MKLDRWFTRGHEGLGAVFATVKWGVRDVRITKPDGEVIFEQTGVEAPENWSDQAVTITVSKYFNGKLGTAERESSIGDLIARVVNQIDTWAAEYGFSEVEAEILRDELAYLILHQMGTFNSPVWFNVGVEEKPQCSACQPYHALVSTPRGLIQIGDLTTGDEVYDSKGITKVVATKSNGVKEVFRVTLGNGSFIEATADHRVKSSNHRRGKPSWVQLGNLEVDKSRLHLYPHAKTTSGESLPVSEAALAGWLVSDGYVGKPRTATSLILEFETVREEEFGWVMGHLKKVFPEEKPNIIEEETEDQDLHYRRIRLAGERFRWFVEKYELLHRGETCRVPKIMFSASPEATSAYLRSVFQADGSVSLQGTSARVQMSRISKEFIEGCQLLLLNLGIYSRIIRKQDKRGNRHDGWEISVSYHSERCKFYEEVGFLSEHKYESLRYSVEQLEGKSCPNLREEEVVEMESLGDMPVYDIQTESGEYLSQGVVVHNCFILSVEDTMESILNLAKEEGMIFKQGSGTGVNYSALRCKGAPLSHGGSSSGPVHFMDGHDRMSGSIKSGGKTRRAARMSMLDVDHPDIMQFIATKRDAEYAAHALVDAGFSADFNDPNGAYSIVPFQNSNHSVRVSDDFMDEATNYPNGDAGAILRAMAEAAWVCGDPGIQYDDVVNRWHTCPGAGRIRASNPCQPAFANVLSRYGIITMGDLKEGDEIWSGGQWTKVQKKVSTGVKEVFKYGTRAGSFIGTENHRIVEGGVKTEVREASGIDTCQGPSDFVVEPLLPTVVLDGLVFGDGYVKVCNGGIDHYPLLYVGKDDSDYFSAPVGKLITLDPFDKNAHRVDSTTLTRDELPLLPYRTIPDRYFRGRRQVVRSFLHGLYSANGSIAGGRVTLKSSSFTVIEQAQQMLSFLGIRSYYTVNKPHDVEFKNGVYTCKESYDLNITNDRKKFRELIGFIQVDKTVRLHKACDMQERNWSKSTYEITEVESLGEHEVFDITVEAEEHTYWTGGLLVSNCGEYIFLDNSACNLASLNLVNFLVNGQFNCQDFGYAVRVFIVAQDILVDRAKYPTEKIAENSRRFRPLGLGYCNLGGVLVALGLGYGTEKGRDFAAQVTALMHGHAVLTSMELADRFGAFLGYEEEPYHDVLCSHADAAGELVNKVEYGEIRSELERVWNEAASRLPHPMRNAQLTLLAPTGTIGFMLGADTTGGEPMLFLRGVKSLVGGGQMVIVPEIVKMGLKNMGVTHVEPIFQAITEGLDLEDIPLFFPQDKFDLHVFDTALPNKHGRYIKPEDHIKMMAAIQPFLSGAISKTVNLPGDATREDIFDLYVMGWKLGLKSLTVYRNGCKKSQPVGSGKEEKDDYRKGSPLLVELELRGHGSQRPLPDECDSKRKKMRIGEHVAYLHVGLYDDGVPGEIFLDMAKQGSTISGLTDAFATAVSIGLQYGVPLEKYVDKFSFVDFEPRGFTGDRKIPFAKSIVDYVFRWIGKTFLTEQTEEKQVIEEQVLSAPSIPKMDLSGPPCPRCGHPTSPGGCGECPTCGKVGGCG